VTDLASNALPLALITGANGGMGRACVRVMGRRHRLILADLAADALELFARDLALDGVRIAAVVPGNIARQTTIEALADAIDAQGPLKALVHTAGVSAVAGWKQIIDVNLVATVRLLDAVESRLRPGAAAVLIASMAGHFAEVVPEIDELFETPLAHDLLPRFEQILSIRPGAYEQLGSDMAAYAQSKRAVLRLCERRAAAWGALGARITTISPGVISTPMSLREAQKNSTAEHINGLVEQTPIKRWGAPADIANVAEFLCSDLASFVSGSDVRVDGGLMAVRG
jgi:NAD(P)-dependent dehydrogenase (short-subunit alcohol dehydrogenase family)